MKNTREKRKIKNKMGQITYIGEETKFITKLFKTSNLKISFKTENTIGKLLTRKIGITQINLINMAYIN